ncbi:MAG TPA: DUF4349 domain-containing protein [Caulobacteraceae bacterium]|jgi:hypothetical protein|nr:DUF4349 domain-containing protein [Caulobacteraceae bacterium]
MNKKLVLALVLAASVAACKKPADHNSALPDVTAPAASAPSSAAADGGSNTTAAAAPSAKTRSTETGTAPTDGAKPLAVTAPDLAYAYNYAVEAPARDVSHLLRQHEEACDLAGPTVCQVVGAQAKSIGNDDVSGHLELRAQPQWIAKFRDRIEDDVRALGGKVSTSDTSTEDFSRSLVDTDAGIRSKIELRDRLETLLKTHKGKLDDLVALEQQVSDVQSQINAAQSELAVMKTRVQTQTLVVDYRSLTALAPDSAFRPVSQAAHSFTGHFMMVVAGIIHLLSVLSPLGLIGGVIWWFLKSRKRTAPVAPPTAG